MLTQVHSPYNLNFKLPAFNTASKSSQKSQELFKDNSQTRLRQVKQVSQEKPPLKVNQSPLSQTQKENWNPMVSPVRKVQCTFHNIDEKLETILNENQKLKIALQNQAAQMVQKEEMIIDLQNYIQHNKKQFLQEKEELFEKIRILINENEKSTEIILNLAAQDKKANSELQLMQESYKQQENQCNLMKKQIKKNEQETQQVIERIHEYEKIIEDLKQKLDQSENDNHDLNQIAEEQAAQIQDLIKQQNNRSQDNQIEDYINQLVSQNKQLAEQLMVRNDDSQLVHDLEYKILSVIQQNQDLKLENEELQSSLSILDQYKNGRNQDKQQIQIIAQLRQQIRNLEVKLSILTEENLKLMNMQNE